MKVTATIKDKSEEFYADLDGMTAKAAFDYLSKNAYGTYAMHGLSLKIGNGQFRDRVDLNQVLRKPDCSYKYRREARRGYFLVTFDIQ